MSADQTYVIVGGGLAGAKAAETLRSEGFDGRVVLVGSEPVLPYERPPLSKAYLRGEVDSASFTVHDAAFYDQQAIELLLCTTVTGVDLAGATITLETGETLRYDRLLLATGSVARHLDVPGADLAGVHYLRTMADSDQLRSVLNPGRKVVVVGTGWIGAEVAASARELGAEVTLVGPDPLPLVRVLGPEIGAVYRDLHAAHGVELRLGQTVASLAGTTSVEQIHLSDGTSLPAEVVVAGIGAVPQLDLARSAGLDLAGGVPVDRYLATTDPRIYAAGDIAAVPYPRFDARIRLEHWSAALNQGPVAARNMLGQATPYEQVPYFFSDQYDLGMEYRGYAPTWDEVVLRGTPASGSFLAFWCRGGRVVAAMNANIWDQGDNLTALIGAPADPIRLADSDTDLASMIAT
jgi:3-phenylpropionate/trans-cinnamate dioxygenase ferredoxin reductase component